LEHDETKLARIAPRFAGWVRELKVNYTGQKVAKGDPLFTVYSPELFEAESEYLLAFERVAQLRSREDTAQAESAKRLLESARRKLSLWEIGDTEIAALEQSGQARDEILVRSPASGHVVTKNAVQGRAFMAGETLYEIADLSHLWVRAYVFEFEAPLIKEGLEARVTFPYLGNRSVESVVSFLYPHIDPQTRRAEVRLEIDNPQLDLRPQMWANVELEASFGEVLTVPANAIIDTGVRLVAFVMRDDNHLEPREVTIGARSDDYYEVLSGLNDGEKVVARALFLIDSESQLKAAISGMGSAGGHNH
jgi:RND family efflux transporter MFP subunit